MADNNWQKVREIFDSALRRKPEERRKFINEACGDDKTLLAEVESLLSSLDGAESFMESPAVAEIADAFEARTKNLEKGTCFGHYEIIRQIGEGGMGEVYLARDKKLDRKVAIKILNEKFAEHESNLNRFIREAKSASGLNHPNILTVHEVGESENVHYIVSEFISGKTLRERLKESSLSLTEVLDIAIQTANALAAAHEAKLVHRDIKPENIMIRPDGVVKILDFGLAKLVEQKNKTFLGLEDSTVQHNPTAKGVILGTINYMSPEQARGKEIDARTDVWSLGVVLYEMLAGRTPFAGETTSDTISAILNNNPAPIAASVPDIHQEIERIIGKTLRKDREERYQHIKDLLIDLKDLKQELEFSEKLSRSGASSSNNQATINKAMIAPTAQMTHTTSSAEYIVGEIKQHKRAVLAVLAILLVSAIGLGYWFYVNRTASTNTDAYIETQKVVQITNWSGLDDFPSLSPDGNTVAYCSDRSGSFEIYVQQLTPGAKEIQLTSDGGQNFQPAFSPDGQRIAYYSKQRGGIWIIPAMGGEARQITDFGSHPAWSPDGRQIVFQSNPLVDLGASARNAMSPSTLWLIASEGGEAKQLTQIGNPSGGHGSPSFSPDGKRIVFEVNDYRAASVWTISTNGDDAKEVIKADKTGKYEPVYAPDGKSILYISGGVFQVRVNPKTNESVGEPSQIAGIGGIPSFVRHVSFSADGKKIAYSVLMRRESLMSARLQKNLSETSGAPAPLVQNTNFRLSFPVFSPDGKQIAFSTCQNAVEISCNIWLTNTDGSNQTQLTTGENTDLMPTWFPDMERMAYISDRTGHWSLHAVNLKTKRDALLLDLEGNLDYARLSPDGNQVVFNFKRDGVINVWTALLAGGEPKQLTFDKEMMGFPAWSPDGKTIAFGVKRGEDTHIMIMPIEGGAPVQLTFDKGQSWIYGWSPDSDKILFAGLREGFWNVYWVSRSTKKQQPLTDYKKLNSFVRYPSWSPFGDQIVYEYSETSGNIWTADLK